MRELVAKFPRTDFAILLKDPVFGLSQMIESTLREEVQREGKTGEAIGENAVVNIAAGCVVAGQSRWALPGLASAARILVVAIAERLMGGEPQALCQEKGKQSRRNPLGKIEMEAANPAKRKGHEDRTG